MLETVLTLGGLFLSAFGAATILPLQSESVLVALLLADHQPAWLLLTMASVGNVLGSAVNWLLGRYIERFRHHRWFPSDDQKLRKAQEWYQRRGKWTLLLSWVPIVGDPLTVIAGVLREPFPVFLLLVSVAKVTRYLALAFFTQQWM